MINLPHSIDTAYDHQVCIANIALGSSDFRLEGGFFLASARRSHECGYIYSGFLDYSWLIGINKDLELCLWVGDCHQWSILNGHSTGKRITVGQHYDLCLTRQGRTLSVYLDKHLISSFALPAGLEIPGSAIGIGCLFGVKHSWELVITPPVAQIESPAVHLIPPGNKVHLLSMFYGERHARWLTEIMFRSLLLKSNLPYLDGMLIEHHIYCTEDELPYLKNHAPSLEKMGITLKINTDVIPRSGNQRQCLYIALAYAIKNAIDDNAVIVMAQADHVFGHGLGKIIEAMTPRQYVVCGHPRISEQKSVSLLPGLLDQFSLSNECNNRPLVRRAFQEISHPMVKFGLNSFSPYWHGIKKDKHYSVYFKEPPPLCFHPYKDQIQIILGKTQYGGFETLDHELVEYANALNYLRVIDNSDDFFWTEITDERVYNPTIVNDYYSNAAKSLLHHELKFFI